MRMTLQDIGKKHGLDDFEKIKQESVLEQVIAQLMFIICLGLALQSVSACLETWTSSFDIKLRSSSTTSLPQHSSHVCGFLVLSLSFLPLVCLSVAPMLQYTQTLENLRKSAEEDMDAAKRRDGLEWVNVDASQLKAKLT